MRKLAGVILCAYGHHRWQTAALTQLSLMRIVTRACAREDCMAIKQTIQPIWNEPTRGGAV
jgi:hypothetical protein